MQLSQALLFAVAAFLNSVSAENLLVAVNSDIEANLDEYLSYMKAHTTDNFAPLLTLYEAGQTYTDDSYTTLVDSAEMSTLSAFATALPWYSSRILPELDASVTSAAVSSTPASSAASSAFSSAVSSASAAASSSAAAASSSAPISSAANSSTASSSAAVSTAGQSSATGSSASSEESSASASASTSAGSSSSTAGAASIVGQGTLAVVMGLGALALL